MAESRGPELIRLGSRSMDYVNLGRSGVKVSRLCLGTMMFGGATDEAESARIIHRALDAGVNFIDTANVYNAGESEAVTGRAIRERRGSVIVATKAKNPMGEGPNDQGLSRVHLMRACARTASAAWERTISTSTTSTRRTGARRWTSRSRAMDDLVRQGKVRYAACSNFYAYQVALLLGIAEVRDLERIACVQPLYNIVNRDAEVELFPLCREEGIGVVVYSPLARGVLTGNTSRGSRRRRAAGRRAATGASSRRSCARRAI